MQLIRHAVIVASLAGALPAQERQLRESHETVENLPGIVQAQRAEATAPSRLLIELAERHESTGASRNGKVEAAQRRLVRWIEGHGGLVRHRYRLLNLVAAELPPEVFDSLRAHPDVAGISADNAVEFQIDRSVPAMSVERTWSAGVTGAGESVVLFDTGVNANHAALRGRVESAVYVSGTACPPDEAASGADFDGHGTHMAGIIASAGTSSRPDFRGVARGLSRVVNAKVACRSEAVMSSTLLAAIESALVASSAPIAVSAATAPATSDDDVFSRAIDSLIDRFDLIWINAAGNGGPDQFSVASPAISYNGISVANLNLAAPDGPAAFESSARGPTRGGRFKPDLAAPGTGIFSAGIVGDEFVSRTGTSMAAAHVAGAAALLRQAGVRNRLAMKALLINTTNRDGWDPDDGWGFVNVDRAFMQRQHTAVGTVAAPSGSAAYYRVIVPAGGSHFATLVWNRTFSATQPFVRNLDLSIYRADNAAAVQRSLFLNQNVEQIAFRNTGPLAAPYIVRVESRNGGARAEPFALASNLMLEPFAAPMLDVSCTFPDVVDPARQVEVSCRTSNVGGLPYFNVTFSAVLGSTTLASVGVGALPVGESKTGVVRFAAPVAPGVYSIGIRIAGISFGGSEATTIPGTLTVSGSGSGGPVVAAVVNGASYTAGFASASWITITGVRLAATTREWQQADFKDGRLPTELDGVRVTVNGKTAHPAYISPGQINALAPDDDFEGDVEVRVRNSLGESAAIVAKRALAPALFTYAVNGSSYVAARAADGTLIGPAGAFPGVASRPARPGEVISLFGTGCGVSNPPVSPDRVVTVASPLALMPTIHIGEDIAVVEYAGIVAPGLCQINVAIPNPLSIMGEVSVTLNFGETGALNEPLLLVEDPD